MNSLLCCAGFSDANDVLLVFMLQVNIKRQYMKEKLYVPIELNELDWI